MIEAQGKKQLAGLLKGLKRAIDEMIAQGQKPHKALGIYNEQLKKYKRLYVQTESVKEFGGEVMPIPNF